jgi:outer membrane receptor protein involved in Fe transport
MGMMPFGRGGPAGGRWNLSVYHTYRISDRVTIAEGGPELNQLDGDALTAGGVPRHELSFEGGVFKNGLGLRLNGTWAATATVRASGAPGTSDLRFGSTFRVNTRLFVNLDQRKSLVEKVPLLKGTRVAFTVDNLFDSRQKVTDEAGLVPLAYQRAYREPQGRVIGIDIRKMF